MTATERASNRTEELRAMGVRRIIHITHDAREYVPAADYDALSAEIDRLRTRSAPTNPAEIGSKSVVEPTAEHWLTAIVELYGSEADDLTMIEQRARELAQEGK